jgi:hypothetical protein
VTRALARKAVQALVRLVLRHAPLRRIARKVLHAAPFLHARLLGLMYRASVTRPAGCGRLSQRARRLHGQLARARRAGEN